MKDSFDCNLDGFAEVGYNNFVVVDRVLYSWALGFDFVELIFFVYLNF
jgi:hypothetical protein